MMKKNGFTLAEVLITLGIIGVVATMTLPALMTNTQEQQAKTGLKKGINTLTLAAAQNLPIAGFNYDSITANSVAGQTNEFANQSLYSLLVNRTSVDATKSTTTAGSNFEVVFRDGTSVIFAETAPAGNALNVEEDGMTHGIGVVYDTNGQKAPNIMSNCGGNVTASAVDSTTTGTDCNNKSQRVIRDRFAVRLRGSIAVPNGPAARWAYEG